MRKPTIKEMGELAGQYAIKIKMHGLKPVDFWIKENKLLIDDIGKNEKIL